MMIHIGDNVDTDTYPTDDDTYGDKVDTDTYPT